eukprot:799733-Amphidinium_carterae.1
MRTAVAFVLSSAKTMVGSLMLLHWLSEEESSRTDTTLGLKRGSIATLFMVQAQCKLPSNLAKNNLRT